LDVFGWEDKKINWSHIDRQKTALNYTWYSIFHRRYDTDQYLVV